MTPLKKLAWGGLSLITPLAFLIYYAWSPADIPATGDESAVTDRTQVAAGHEILGFTYQYDRGGQKIIAIRADRLSIRKMKMGFFRVSLLHEPLLENGLVQLYDQRLLLPSATDVSAHPTSALDQLFSREILPDLPVRKITAVAIKPVAIELFNDTGEMTTRISADSAVVGFSRRDVRFKGNVRVISGPRELLTSHLRLSAGERLLTTERPFVLKDPEGQNRGRKLTADLLLQPVIKGYNLPR